MACGWCRTRAELLGNVAADHFMHRTTTILEDTGVLARVVSAGRALPGCDMPVDDPLTTWRVERLRLVEVFLSPSLMSHAEAIGRRYDVPVSAAGAWWPASRPAPRPTWPGKAAFLAELRLVGFGTADVGPSQEDAWLSMCEQIADSFREGASAEEIARALFDSEKKPTLKQVESLIISVLGNLAPDVYPTRGWQWSKPLTTMEVFQRNAQAMTRKMPRVQWQ